MSNFFTTPELQYALKKKDFNIDPFLVMVSNLNKEEPGPNVRQKYFSKTLEFATAGSPLAMCLCSGFYVHGWGVEKSYSKAFEYAKMSADKGFAPGIFELASFYEKGIGVHQDFNKALELYESASKSGYGFSTYYLATLFYEGKIVKQDIKKAILYAEQSFEQGECLAAALLAGWYEEGHGLEKDFKKAVHWYKRGVECGNPFASYRLSIAYQKGELALTKNEDISEKYMQKYNALISL